MAADASSVLGRTASEEARAGGERAMGGGDMQEGGEVESGVITGPQSR